jgi:hypothetical protein
MANYVEMARTNYFKVKEDRIEDFQVWADTMLVEVVDNWKEGTVAILMDEGVPSFLLDEQDEMVEIDFVGDLSEFLADGEVAVIEGVGYENLRYLSGFALAVNNKNEQRHISLTEIYKLAQELGEGSISLAEY